MTIPQGPSSAAPRTAANALATALYRGYDYTVTPPDLEAALTESGLVLIEAASAVVSEPPTALDVERLADALYECGFTIGVEPVRRADMDRLIAAYNAPATGESRPEDGR